VGDGTAATTGGGDPGETIVLAAQQRPSAEAETVRMAIVAGPATDLWERPPKPEPLDAPWIRQVCWILPALLVLALGGLGAWTGPVSWPDDAATPLYTDLLRWWDGAVDGSAIALRAPSVLAMAAAAGLTAGIGERIGGLRVGVVAGLLFAALPTTTRWAQEPGPVALAVASAALATLLLLRLQRRPRMVVAAGYALAVAALGLTGGVAAWLLLGAHAVAIAADVTDRRTSVMWGVAALIAGASAAVPVVLGRGDPLAGGQRISPAVTWLPLELFGGMALAGAVLALVFMGVSLRRSTVVVTLWAVVPTVALLASSALLPVFSARPLLVTVPAWTLLAAMALRRFTLARGLGATLAIALLGVPAQVDLRRPAEPPVAVIRA
jgi:mannosyltransferase